MSRLIGTLVCACLSAPVLAFADDKSLAEKASSWIERNPRRLVHELNQAGFYVSLGSLGEGAGTGPGLSYFNADVGQAGLDVFLGAAWSFQGDSLYNLRLGRIPHVPGRAPSRRRTLEALTPSLVEGSNARPFFVYGEIRRQDLAEGRMFGAGGDAEIPFTYRDESYEVVMGYRLAPRLVASVRAGWLETQADVDAGAMPGLRESAAAFGSEMAFQATTLSLAYDRRDHPRDPRGGTFLEAALAHHEGRGSASPRFDRFTLDARQYVPLGSERHVLALRGFMQVADDAPVYLQHTLGGSRTLRGYPQYRFRGTRLASLTAEYRFHLNGAVELAALYDGGRVWGGPDGMGTPGFVASYGAGLRVKVSNDVLVRVDAARGSEGARVNLSFGYSF